MIYLLIGLIFYATLSVIRWHTFKNASTVDVIKGFLLGVFLWPIVLPIIVYIFRADLRALRDYKNNF